MMPYFPRATSVKAKWPCESVCAVSTCDVATLRKVTAAPGMAAPLGSFTFPSTVAAASNPGTKRNATSCEVTP